MAIDLRLKGDGDGLPDDRYEELYEESGERLREWLNKIKPILAEAHMEGISGCVVLHVYDPLIENSIVLGVFRGDKYAVESSVKRWLPGLWNE